MRPSVSWKLIWMKSDGGGDCDGGRVRKTNVLGCKDNLRVERRAARLVSPGAGAGVDIFEEGAGLNCSSGCWRF